MKLSKKEISDQAMTAESLDSAVLELREVGFVTLEAVLPRPWVNRMRKACDAALSTFVEEQGGDAAVIEKRRGHVGMMAPMRMPFMDALAIENPFALQVMEAAMGPGLYCTFYNTNTAWPGSGIQGTHRDCGHLFPELPFALPVATVVVNINLVEFTLESGSTEVWPGTHLVTDGKLGAATYEERVARLPSVRTHMPAGSVTVRDMRMWHRGMPNLSDRPRTMLAVVYNRPFIAYGKVIDIPAVLWEQLSPRAQQLFRHNRIVEQAVESKELT